MPSNEHDPKGGAIVWPIIVAVIIAAIWGLAKLAGVK